MTLLNLVRISWLLLIGFASCLSQCPSTIDELDQLKQLNTYANEWPGLYHDHFTTMWTHSSHPNALNRYNFVETLGMVLTNDLKCPCAVEVVQLLDEQMGFGGTLTQPGLFGRINHKMALKQNRSPTAIDNYLLTGERFYCASKYGQCGASVPLREWYVDAEYDTIMTTNTSMEGTLGITFKGILCYIWPANYKAGSQAPLKNSIPLNDDKIGLMSVGIPNELECRHLNSTNGDWTFNSLKRVIGTVATLNCHPNHSHKYGSSVVVCQKNHKWMPNPATHCVECKTCIPFPTHPFAEITYSAQLLEDEAEDREFYPAQTTASLVCSNNTGVSHGSADVSVCTTHGWVPDRLGHCEKVCTPFTIKNGHVIFTNSRGFDEISHVNGTIATAVCQPSARLVNGSGSAICIDGQWSTPHLGACEWPTCRPIENTHNGQLHYSMISTDVENVNSSLHYPGTTVRLHCNSNYSIKGASESICESQGNWQPNIGHCA